jgi:hypothetical protein
LNTFNNVENATAGTNCASLLGTFQTVVQAPGGAAEATALCKLTYPNAQIAEPEFTGSEYPTVPKDAWVCI